jgi:hypothetical protein
MGWRGALGLFVAAFLISVVGEIENIIELGYLAAAMTGLDLILFGTYVVRRRTARNRA